MIELTIHTLDPRSFPGVDVLVSQAEREGFRFLTRLRSEYASGANRFDQPGELLLGASCRNALSGVGGLNRDPYGGLPRAGRIRHVYVRPAERRSGVGSHLVRALVEHAVRQGFEEIVLRTDTSSAAAFYERLGFEPVAMIAGATHRLGLTSVASRAEG